MKFKRSSGILLHPSSLPGPYGIGDIGPNALHWIDFLDKAGIGLWQVLPLGPTGYGDSPYQCFSAFAGNPYLLSPDSLIADGVITSEEISPLPAFPAGSVDFGWVINWKVALLDKAFKNFAASAKPALKADFEAFKQAQESWLKDYALFMAIKDAHGGQPWTTWEPELRDRSPEALAQAAEQHQDVVQRQMFLQFMFFRQWQEVLSYAHKKNIQVVGDIPIFVAHDSADVWANPELFFLDQTGKPTVVAGVPPDYFSETGQLWGNPLYRWDLHKKTGYAWWVKRFRAVLSLVDVVRLDHFRGFAGYWEVPGDAKTAINGRWATGPGKDFMAAVESALGSLPIIAEDLGLITPDVVELRDHFNLPGMKILQFGFDGDGTHAFLPHNYTSNCVAYTGTHDNDTAQGWYERAPKNEVAFYRKYMNQDGSDFAWDLIRGVWGSVAVFGLAPMQDFLSLNNSARMNYPGNPSGNWAWRMDAKSLTPELAAKIKDINILYNRLK